MHSHRKRPSSGAIGAWHDSLVCKAKVRSSSVQCPRTTPSMAPMSFLIWCNMKDCPTTVVFTNSTPFTVNGALQSKLKMYLIAAGSSGSTRTV